ncbi:hypothetical protein [Aquisediminimonas sediminicola]|uniref:hypothetical protein n=1 Tax=Alteraquisediminimonas sediminicola TaxID=2676787 RepID=UPI001C8E8159|nr:hypothetical protein [Aquisediminimonas sediminicola]
MFPQAPGGDIRRLGFPHNKLGRAFALAALKRRWWQLSGADLVIPHQRHAVPQGRTAAAPYWRESLSGRTPAPALEA